MVRKLTYQKTVCKDKVSGRETPRGSQKNKVMIQNNRDWENLFDSIPDFILILDDEYRIVKSNRTVTQKLGQEVVGLKCYKCIHKLDKPPEFCPHMKLLADGQEHTVEIYEETLGGHFLVTTSPIRDARGELIGSVHIARNITDRKQMEEELRKSQELYYNIVESMSDGIVVLDRTFHYTHWNKVMEKISRTPQEKAISKTKTAWEIFPHLAKYGVREMMKAAMRGKVSRKRNIPYRLQDGTYGFTSDIFMPLRNVDGDIRGILGVVRDVTEEKTRQEKVREIERKYRTLFESANDAILIVKADDTCYIDCNEKAPKLFGCKKEQIIGKPFLWFSPECQPDGQKSSEKIPAIVAKALDGTAQLFEWRYKSLAGSEFDAEVSLNRLESAGESYLLSILRDVTERKKAEEALRLSEKNYSALVESTLTGLCVEQKGTIIFTNKMFSGIFGFLKKDMEGMGTHSLILPEDRHLLSEIREAALQGTSTLSGYELRCLSRGKKLWVLWKGTTVEYKGSRAILFSVADISMQKHMEIALRESESRLHYLSSKLLSAQEQERTRMSRELHDELGQSLSFLKLQIKTINRNLQKDPSCSKRDCQSTLKHVDEIIASVRQLSRDLSPSIVEVLGLSNALMWLFDNFSKHYKIKTSIALKGIEKDLFSREDQVNIYRVFQESLTNIVKHAEASFVSILIEWRGNEIFCSVKDNGKGFERRGYEKKAISEKGLGITIMHERVRMLGGTLELWSKKGKGTSLEFTISPKSRGNV